MTAKTALLTAAVTLGLATGAPGQGAIYMSDEGTPAPPGGVTLDMPGRYYTGTGGMELWALRGTNIPPGVNQAPAVGYAVSAYNTLVAAGFRKEASWSNVAFDLGYFNMGIVTVYTTAPAGSQVTLALVAWNNDQATFPAAAGVAGTEAGVVAFVNSTGDPTMTPPGAPVQLAMPTDLVMMPIPEPGSLAIASLGIAGLLAFARRKVT